LKINNIKKLQDKCKEFEMFILEYCDKNNLSEIRSWIMISDIIATIKKKLNFYRNDYFTE